MAEVEEKQGRTVYAQMRIMPINTEKNTQPVQNFVQSPLKRFAATAAEMTIVVENTKPPTSNPSFRADGEK
jgi:hypothetical protein